MKDNKILVCEVCGEVLRELTDDISSYYICRSNHCGIAVRRGVSVDRETYEAKKTAQAA